MVKMIKFHLNAHNFTQNHSNLIKRIFLNSSHKDLSNDIYVDWFLGRPHFFIVFGNDIIMTSFLVTHSSNLHMWWTFSRAISLKGFNAVNFLGHILQRNYKNTMMTSL